MSYNQTMKILYSKGVGYVKDKRRCFRCKSVFDKSEAVNIDIDLYGFKIKEKRCPYCGGEYGLIVPPGFLDKFLYVNEDNKYYMYNKGNN